MDGGRLASKGATPAYKMQKIICWRWRSASRVARHGLWPSECNMRNYSALKTEIIQAKIHSVYWWQSIDWLGFAQFYSLTVCSSGRQNAWTSLYSKQSHTEEMDVTQNMSVNQYSNEASTDDFLPSDQYLLTVGFHVSDDRSGNVISPCWLRGVK